MTLPIVLATAPQRFFSYGTLRMPCVLKAVIGRPLEGVDAWLSGFSAVRIRGEVYPGIIASAGGMTRGKLYASLAPWELVMLDRFEGRLYQRIALVVAATGGRRVRAWVYRVAPGREKMLAPKPWHLKDFVRTGYQRFAHHRRTRWAPQAP